MTEAEWLASTRPTAMLLSIKAQASERKVLLFNCACCRRIWTRLDAEDQDATEQAEAIVEDPAAVREWRQRFEPERAALLALVGLGPRDHPVSESLGRSLATRTTIRLRLDGQRGSGIGSLAFEAARLSARPGQAGAGRTSDVIDPETMAPEEREQATLARDIFGNPFRPSSLPPACRPTNVLSLARAAYDERYLPVGYLDNARLGVLSDALEEAGCTDADILSHLRSPGPHVRGCWALDLVLGKG